MSWRKEKVAALSIALMLLDSASSRGAMKEPSIGINNDCLGGYAVS